MWSDGNFTGAAGIFGYDCGHSFFSWTVTTRPESDDQPVRAMDFPSVIKDVLS
jgi:hypothetical protein